MGRGLLLVAVVALFVAAPAQAAAPCSRKPCVHRVVATTRVQRWRSPETIPRDARLDIHVWRDGKKVPARDMPPMAVVFYDKAVFVAARGRRRAAPVTFRFAAMKRRTTLKLVYETF